MRPGKKKILFSLSSKNQCGGTFGCFNQPDLFTGGIKYIDLSVSDIHIADRICCCGEFSLLSEIPQVRNISRQICIQLYGSFIVFVGYIQWFPGKSSGQTGSTGQIVHNRNNGYAIGSYKTGIRFGHNNLIEIVRVPPAMGRIEGFNHSLCALIFFFSSN